VASFEETCSTRPKSRFGSSRQKSQPRISTRQTVAGEATSHAADMDAKWIPARLTPDSVDVFGRRRSHARCPVIPCAGASARLGTLIERGTPATAVDSAPTSRQPGSGAPRVPPIPVQRGARS